MNRDGYNLCELGDARLEKEDETLCEKHMKRLYTETSQLASKQKIRLNQAWRLIGTCCLRLIETVDSV